MYLYRNEEGQMAYSPDPKPGNIGCVENEQLARMVCALVNGDITNDEMAEWMNFTSAKMWPA